MVWNIQPRLKEKKSIFVGFCHINQLNREWDGNADR